MSKEQQNLVVGLDIGTSKIVAIVAELMPEGDLKVIGLGQQRIARFETGGSDQYRFHPLPRSSARWKKRS